MSWSPNPYDEHSFTEYENRTPGNDSAFTNLNGADQSTVLRSQLPSVQALHNGSGMTMTRRKYADKKKKSTGDPDSVVTIDGKGLLYSEYNVGVPLVSGMPDNTMTVLEELTWKDLDCLRELTCSMAKKKEIRNNLKKEKGAVVKSGWQQRNTAKWKRFQEDTKEVFRHLQLWRSSIHEIEGRFGNGIRSYFAFLRWLFILNMYIFTLVFCFICVPTIVFESLNVIPPTATTNCTYSPYDSSSVASFSQYIIWWFTGQGFMENTLLFIGYYENTVNFTNGIAYNLPLAYILVTFSYFILSLALTVKRAAVGVKESLASGENRFYTYCNKVFGGWDYCITDEGASKLKHNSLKYELETDLEEERIRREQAERTTKQKVILYSKRVFINIIVLCVLAGSLAAIYFAAQYALTNSSTFDDDFFLDLLVTYLTSIAITIANFIAPLLFEILIVYEDYSPAFSIKFTLIRTVILRLVSIMFLYVVVYFQINCERYQFIDINVTECGYCENTPCWETYMGQEMYKLTILDFFIVVGVTLFVEFPRRLLVDHCSCGLTKLIGHQEFAIPTNVLDIVYAQTIMWYSHAIFKKTLIIFHRLLVDCAGHIPMVSQIGHQQFHIPSNVLSLVNSQAVMWIGAFYSPLIPVIVIIKFFVFFYMKKLTLLYNCKPAARPYRASRSGTFFFIILMFGFVVAAIPVGVSLSSIKPSNVCGPFRGLNNMFDAVTNTILTFPNWIQSILWFLGSAGCAVIIGILLSLALYYYKSLSSARQKMIMLLKEQLTLEGKDKQFLLKRVNNLQRNMTGGGQVRERKKRAADVVNASSTHLNPAYEDDNQSVGSASLPGQTSD